MTPEDEEAHLAALLAGDDSSVNSADDEKVVEKDGEDTGTADEAGKATRDEADSTHGADKEKGLDEDTPSGADDKRAGHDEDTADQAKDTQDGGDARVDSDKEEVAVAKGTSIDNETNQRGESDRAVAKSSEGEAENSAPQFESKVDAPATPDLKSQTPPRNTLPLPIAAIPERPPRRSVEQPRTPDPEIQELRDQLATAQSIISTQTARLGDLEEMHQRLSEQHKFLSAAKEAVEARLRDEVSKREAAEEAAESLRGQVEVARRGVMTLQKQEKERKRASMMGVPAGGIPGVGLGLNDVGEETEALDEAAAASNSRQLKRSSTLLRNRRSSQTELEAPHVSPNATPGATASTANAAAPAAVSPPPTNPPRSGLRELRLGANTAQMSPKLGSGAIVSSPSSQTAHLDDPYAGLIRERAVSGTSSTADHGSAIAELESVRAELLVAQVRLSESEEARQASEDCLKALREFITGSTSPAAAAEAGSDEAAVSPGIVDLNDPAALMALKGIRLPPLPTDKEPDEPAPSVPEKKGWGFKIPTWKAATGSAMQTPLSPSSQAVEPATPRTGMSPPPSIRSSSYTSHNEDGTGPVVAGGTGAGAAAATPLASFVSSWTRGVQPATPAAINNTTAQATDAAATQATPRGFGAFFRRTNTATSNPANKDLPARPTSINENADADEVGSVGAEKDDDMDKNRLPAMSREGSNSGRMDLESRLRSQLQPSPEIKVGTLDGDTDEKEEPFKPSTSADGDLSFGTVDSDAVLNTPNMAGEPLGQGEKQGEKA